MPPTTASKNRTTSDSSNSNSNRSSPSPGIAIKPNTRRNGPPTLIEEHQDIKDYRDGRKFLEKHLLLCPPGEPATHSSISTCLHQISELAGTTKQVVNAIRSVAFMLEEMEDTQIHDSLRTALDAQMTEFTSDMKLLIEDAKEKINENIKTAEERLNKIPAQMLTQPNHLATGKSYASILVNAPAHANPKIAAKEGIKARQYLIEGIKNSKFSHHDNIQLKKELNDILSELGYTSGKIRSVSKTKSGGIVVETENDETANWLANQDNQHTICERIGANAEFRNRTFIIIAFNVPLALNPEDKDHRIEICEANNLEESTITTAKWAKAVDRRSPNQKTAHLLLTFSNAEAANRAITNGLLICNRRCHVERSKREPIRCLKCQGWNHLAKECTEEKDTCGNCAGPHRTNSCLTKDTRCASCKTEDHASWNRACPTFLRKAAEFNNRNPDNLLQYFPTADSWTWSAMTKTPPPPILPTKPRPSPVQLGKRPQIQQKTYDTYIPGDTYIPNYGSVYSAPAPVHNDAASWGELAGPSSSRPPNSNNNRNDTPLPRKDA